MMTLLLTALLWLAQAPAPGTGAIHGRVVDKETGAALPHAVVRINRANGGEMIAAVADDRGQFRFDGLEPGSYNGMVMARQHSMAGLPAPDGRSLTVKNNEVREVVVPMSRAYAIGVRVLDESGDPLSDVYVSTAVADSGQQRGSFLYQGTDDLGRLRIFELPPGRYTICAESAGRSSSRHDSNERLLRTCYAAAPGGAPEAVRIDRADVDGIEIRMRRGRTATVSGTVVDASGTPAPSASVMLGTYEASGSSSSTIMVDAQGHFRADGIEPGAYSLEARLGGSDQPELRRVHEKGFLEINVADADLADLVLPMTRTFDVPGRVTLEDPSLTLPPIPGSGLIVYARPAGSSLPGMGGADYATMKPDRTFTLKNVYGARNIEFQNVPAGWYVKAVRYGDRDALDSAVEFRDGADAPPLEVVLSNRGAVISASVTDDSGAPAARAMVYLLRSSKTGRVIVERSARTSPAGVVRLGPVRGGDYTLVALPAAASLVDAGMIDRVRRLMAAGEAVTLTDLDERGVQLRVAAER
jgi:protocatechuate 3,4-dioxygenase beta subunit